MGEVFCASGTRVREGGWRDVFRGRRGLGRSKPGINGLDYWGGDAANGVAELGGALEFEGCLSGFVGETPRAGLSFGVEVLVAAAIGFFGFLISGMLARGAGERAEEGEVEGRR